MRWKYIDIQRCIFRYRNSVKFWKRSLKVLRIKKLKIYNFIKQNIEKNGSLYEIQREWSDVVL